MPVVTISGTSSSAPYQISIKESDTTYVVASAEYALLPVAPQSSIRYRFVVLSGGSLYLLPFGDDVIRVGDSASGTGMNGGYAYIEDLGQVIEVYSAGSSTWSVDGSGVIGAGDDIATPETRTYRGGTRGVVRTKIIEASTINTGSATSAPASHALGWSFAAGATNDLGGLTFVMPSDWTAGSNITIFVHYAKSTPASGTVKWQERHRITDATRTLAAWSSWADIDTTVSGDGDTADRQAIVSFPALDMSLAGSPIHGRAVAIDIRRVSSGGSADTYASAAILLAIGVHYSSDIPGWRSSFTK